MKDIFTGAQKPLNPKTSEMRTKATSYRTFFHSLSHILAKVLLLAVVFISITSAGFGQTTGNYRTIVTGTWNWTTVANWQTYDGTAWVAATDYPGQNPGAMAVTIRNNTNVTLDVSPANSIASLRIRATNSNTSLSIGNNTLNVTNAINLIPPTSGTTNNTLDIGSGIVSCSTLTGADSGNNTLDNFVLISTGTLNVSGDITLGTNANQNSIAFSGAGTINVAGSLTTGTLTGNAGTINVGVNFTPTTFTANTSTVNYNGTGNQTITAASYYNLLITNSKDGNTVTLNGAINVANTFSPTATFSTGGYVNTGSTINFNGTGDQTIPAFNYNNITVSGARTTYHVTFANSGIIGIAGTATNSATFSSGGYVVTGSTVDFNGDVNQNIPAFTFNNLNISDINSAAVTPVTKTLVASPVIVNGDLNVTGVGTTNVTLQLSTRNFTVNGSTNVSAYGIIGDNSATGTDLFVGNVAIGANSQWLATGNPAITFQNGISYDGAGFTSGSGTYTFNTNNQTISGSQSLTITNITTTGITLTNQNIAGLTCSVISGTGNFTNGDASNAAILNVTAVNPFSLSGTLDLDSNPNTVNYSGTGTQTIKAYNYYNLSSSSSGSRTLTNGTTGIKGTFNPGTNAFTVNNSTIEFNGTSPQNIPVLRPATPIAYSNIKISGNSTKTLAANVTIGGVLNLNGGILELADNNLTFSSNSATAIQGTFSSSNMIATNGLGYLIKNAVSAQQLYPVGSNGYYSPMTLTAIAPTTGTLSVRAVPTAINPSYINKYWDVTSSVVRTSATATFQYDPAELNGALPSISYSPDAGTTWQNPPTNGTASYGGSSFTITGTNPFAGWWTMGYRTYYSYQTGSWNNPTTWTSDPSGTLQIGTTVPGYNDKIVILTGRTVSLPADITTGNLDVTINAGGFINMGTYSFTSALLGLRGQGTLQLASVNFPTVTPAANNTLVNAGGGTVEYNNAASFNLPIAQTTYNNLTINAPAITATQTMGLTLNGDLYVKQGTFQINDNTAARLQLTIFGDVTVDAAGSIAVGTGNTTTTTDPTAVANGGTAPYINYYDLESHRVSIYGDFTNNGTVRFTNQSYPTYTTFPTNGFATVYFMGTTSNTLTCNNTTDFYNLVLAKGTDQTYSLTINPSAYANFRLFGADNAGYDNTAPASDADPNLKKALWIRNGTLILTGFTVIPSLSEGTCSGVSSDFFLPASGAMVLDNLNVVVLSTADDYREVNAAYGVAGPSNAAMGITQGFCSSFSINGKLQVNDGYFSTRESGGFITWNYASGQLEINGGTVDAKQFRAAGVSGGLASYIQTGGTFILRGMFQRQPSAYTSVADLVNAPISTARAVNGTNGGFGTFNLNDPANIFSMSGGTIQIYDGCGNGAVNQKVFDVFSSSGNISVTGGTLQIIPTHGTGAADATTQLITSTAPLGNLTINRASGATTVGLSTYPLTVLGNLNIASGDLVANDFNVSVGGNYTAALGTTYTPGNNWTIFNGTGSQTFSINTAAAYALKKFKVDKPAGSTLTLAGTQTTLSVVDSMMIVKGNLNDGGKTIDFVPSTTTSTSYLYNSGIHSGAGKIRLSDTDPQVIDGDGNGVFQNLELNNTNAAAAPISLSANITVNGNLTFSQDKLFNIGTYNLKLGPTASVVNASATRYIQTGGNLGDGGLTRVYPSATSLTFPVGASSTRHAAPAYTPATLAINGSPTALGSITVVPVGYEHPATTVNGRSLTYFWHVKSSGFTLGSATVTQGYTYNQADVVTGGAVTEATYVAARYNGSTYTWTNGTTSDIDVTNNIIGEPGAGTFLENEAFIDGDYTAGDGAFGTPKIFYSRINGAGAGSGLWSDPNTWSFTSNIGPANTGGVVPGVNDIVIIAGQDSIYLSNESPQFWDVNPNPSASYYQLNKAVVSCASLKIEAGSVLDIQNNPGCKFGIVLNDSNGNGKLRITTRNAANFDASMTFAFPSGDFSEFNVNLGTTELYTVNGQAGTTYWLPNGITSYGNLVISPRGGSNIIFPNNDLLIYGNLITNGQNSDSWFCPTWNLNYPTAPVARVAKTVTIKGNFDLQGGALIWYGNNNLAQDFVINGDLVVNTNAGIQVYSAATNQSISIGGSLVNNSLAPGGSPNDYRGCNFTGIPLTFFGATNDSITNTSGTPYTILSKVTVNKGSSQATTLTLDIGGTLTTPVDNWLTLQNGTLRYMRTNPSSHFTITTTSPFSIPSTAGLYVDYPANSGNRDILIANGNSNTNDLFLDGKLTIVNGNVYVGTAGANYNNDIEYSGGGGSTIDVQNASLLVVNGQIRRNTSSAVGVLSYSQSGSSQVVINGNAANTTRAKLEVLNPGSSFNMSGTSTLSIVRGGGGSTYGDLYLRPASSSITGGTILFSQIPTTGPTVDAVQSYQLESNVSLNNLTITGKTAATARNATVSLMVSPLVLKGSLTLSNTRSIFNSNNNNVTIGGDLNNSGTYNYGTNTTTFNATTYNSGMQAITGSTVTNFYDLTVSPLTSLTVNNPFTVNSNLNITGGNLVLAANKLTLLGNITNNGTYTDDNGTGGVTLQGSTQQLIAGVGQYGKLELNNNKGAVVQNDVTLNNDLALTLGVLDIGSHLLTLGTGSNILGSPFGITNMIKSDGVASAQGVKKFFPIIGSSTNFTYPIGVAGKYTPALLNLSNNSTVGSIRLNPINTNHPAVVDPTNVLKYYWQVETSGVSNLNGSVKLDYLASDVQGTESAYVAAKLPAPYTYWYLSPPGSSTDNVDESIHEITFPIVAGTNIMTGDYTAGLNTAITEEVPTYQSIKDGNWSDNTVWEPIGSAPPCPAGGPNGFNVIVNNLVTTDVNYCSAYQTTINGTLQILAGTFGHNLGTVDGTGTLLLQGGNLPAGNFDAFLSCSNNGTLEYGGSGNYTIIASQYNSVPNLFFTGTGTRVLPNKDLTICQRLVIDGPTLDNSVSNRKLTILGTFERYNTGAFIAGTGANATISFAGSTPQSLGGPTGDFYNVNGLYNLEINNPSGLTIGSNGRIEVYGNLLLTQGLINTSLTNRLTLLNTSSACVIPSSGSTSSFVNGPLEKYIPSGTNFNFPIGKGNLLSHLFQITSVQTVFWTAEFFSPNSTANALTAPLMATNTSEYWNVKILTGSKDAKIKIGWDNQSDLTPLMTVNGISDMRVADYNTGTSKWEQQASTTSGNATLGDVATTNSVTIGATPISFTTASVTTTKPLAALNPSGAVCGAAGIPVKFTSFTTITLPYTLDYTINGTAQTTITVNTLPYTLPTPTAGDYQLTGFKYNGGTIAGVVNPTVVTDYTTPTAPNAGPDQSLCGYSGTTLAANNPAPYTGLWSVSTGTGGSVLSPTQYNSVFNGISGNSYTLKWTISNGGCTASDLVDIAFPVAPQKPGNFTAAPTTVCQNSTANVYTVPSVPATTYTWTYSGSGATINGTGNSVSVDFNATATSGTISVTATNSCGTSTARTASVTILPLPDAAGSITGTATVCQGASTENYSVGAIANASGYTWTLPAGATITAGANTNNITVNFSSSAVSGNITVAGTNSCGSGPVSPSYFVTVNNPPTITLDPNPVVCSGSTTATQTYSATTNNPDLYSIDFDATAEGQGFVDVTNVALPAGAITITVPPAAVAGTYNGILTLQNSVTGCISQAYSITVTINPPPVTSWLTGNSSTCAGNTGDGFSITPVAGCSYVWSVEDNVGTIVGSGTSITVNWLGNAGIFTGVITSVVKNVTVVVTNTTTGCATTLNQPVTIHRVPDTGPEYHISNDFGY